jgi:hypothetical protein
MKKYWTIVFPGEHGQHVQETWTEPQILESYYDYWSNRMIKKGKNLDEYTEQDCIEDWCIVHWAEQTDSLGNKL